ncbi:MAG: phospho-sugar mutase [Actinomycetota bacterium]|nr:phospho-sugar mutase [Actinomycetota bacterium]
MNRTGEPGQLPDALRAKVEAWMAEDPDPATRAELAALVAVGDRAELEARFAQPLRFGTAGLRAALGAGPARMNRAVVRATTAGLARWLLGQGPLAARGLVVGRDARHQSARFAADTAEVAAAAGVPVHQLDEALPTPITAFAVRHLTTAAGVMITASHNPASDNGYKVYVADGAQVIPPADAEIAAAAGAPRPSELPRAPIHTVDREALLAAYRAATLALLDASGERQVRTVYTPMHGVGGAIVPELLARCGFPPVIPVRAQLAPDPDFPTVAFPNPEEPGALDLALGTARREGAQLVLANDPDADRLAVAVPDRQGGWRALSGDELGILLAEHVLAHTSGSDRLVATTIVSSSMLGALAAEAGVRYAQTLTGFKWIARAASTLAGSRLVFGYEEALGYAVNPSVVADKDGMSAALVVCEMAAEAVARGEGLLERLDRLAARLGVHLTGQSSLRLEGRDGPGQIAAVMAAWRNTPPDSLAGHAVSAVDDLAAGAGGLPPTDGVRVRLGDAARVVLRPSGTEPKVKAYLEVVTPPPGAAGLDHARREAGELLCKLREDVTNRCRAALQGATSAP